MLEIVLSNIKVDQKGILILFFFDQQIFVLLPSDYKLS